MPWPEIAATLLGIANIALLVRRNIWNYPFGLACVAIYAIVFARARLYSDALLQVFFFALQVYGWRVWARAGGEEAPVAVRRMGAAARIATLAVGAAATLLWGAVAARWTNAAAPFWDGGVAMFSVLAQLLLARRYLENWALWMGVDAAAIALYASRGLYVTAGLYILFFFFATAGLGSWTRALRAGAR